MGKPFSKVVSVTGAAPQNLLTVMQTNGYPSNLTFGCSLAGTELALGSPAAQSLFYGGSDVSDTGSTKGFELGAGSFDTQRASGFLGNIIDPSQIWLFVASTSDVEIRYSAL